MLLSNTGLCVSVNHILSDVFSSGSLEAQLLDSGEWTNNNDNNNPTVNSNKQFCDVIPMPPPHPPYDSIKLGTNGMSVTSHPQINTNNSLQMWSTE